MNKKQILINSKQIMNFLLFVMLCLTVTSCKLMPYRNDFDCPVPKGLKCKSLYEINKMADQGIFDPNIQKNPICCNEKHKQIIKK